MAAPYDTVDLIDMQFDADADVFSFPCPCGDKFFISIEELLDSEDVANCPSCSLVLKVTDKNNAVDEFRGAIEETLVTVQDNEQQTSLTSQEAIAATN